jgi:hypothetical protein
MPTSFVRDFVWTNVQKSVVLMAFSAIRAGRSRGREIDRDGGDEIPRVREIRR